MKKFYTLFLIAVSVFAINAQTKTVKISKAKPVILIVGSYHMANPNRDLNNAKVDDVLTKKRQKEISDFVALLKKFKPTKIGVELPAEQKEIDADYNKYFADEYTLTANEVDQIGFRLARQMGHKRVFTIDWQGNFDFDKVETAAKEFDQAQFIRPLMEFGKEAAEKEEKIQKTATVTQIFHFLNEENFIEQSHTPYIRLLQIGKDKNYAGADLVKDWYERNLKIFSNITRITDSPNDRILILIGAGHVKLLKQFAVESRLYEVEKTAKYF